MGSATLEARGAALHSQHPDEGKWVRTVTGSCWDSGDHRIHRRELFGIKRPSSKRDVDINFSAAETWCFFAPSFHHCPQEFARNFCGVLRGSPNCTAKTLLQYL